MKIASGGVQHETNTFSDTPTTLADFQRDSGCGPEFSGGKVLEKRFAGTGTIHGGYLAGAAEGGCGANPFTLGTGPTVWPSRTGRLRPDAEPFPGTVSSRAAGRRRGA